MCRDSDNNDVQRDAYSTSEKNGARQTRLAIRVERRLDFVYTHAAQTTRHSHVTHTSLTRHSHVTLTRHSHPTHTRHSSHVTHTSLTRHSHTSLTRHSSHVTHSDAPKRFQTANVTFNVTQGHYYAIVLHRNYVSILHRCRDIISYFPKLHRPGDPEYVSSGGGGYLSRVCCYLSVSIWTTNSKCRFTSSKDMMERQNLK